MKIEITFVDFKHSFDSGDDELAKSVEGGFLDLELFMQYLYAGKFGSSVDVHFEVRSGNRPDGAIYRKPHIEYRVTSDNAPAATFLTGL